MRCALFFLALSGVWGQTLEVTPSSVDRGSANIFRILLKTSPGKEPAALQWEIAAPAEIAIELAGIVASGEVEGVGKALTCAAKKGAEAGRAYACVLVGGVKPIPGGAIAIVRYTADTRARAGEVKVRVEKAAGASVDLRKLPIIDASGIITIR
jgi:hypothetical protein